MKEKKTNIDEPTTDSAALQEGTTTTVQNAGDAAGEAKADKPRHRKKAGDDTANDSHDDDSDDDENIPSLTKVIKETAIEGERPQSRTLSLRKMLGGDLLNTAFVRQQIWLFVLIGVFMIIYVSNRYSCQKDILEIDRLQNQLQDAKYRALSSTSELTERSRESNVLNALKAQNDSTLKMSGEAPFYIKVPEREEEGR